MVVTLGQQYNVGEKPTDILLYTYVDHHAQPPIITQHNHCTAVVVVVLHCKRMIVLIMSIIVQSNHTRVETWVNSKM